MVKIFPTSFNFIEKQKLLSCISGEPLAITCSDECLFVAEEDCLLEVFNLESLKLMGQFRTVSPVQHLVYNTKGDCIITMEKTSSSQGFARIYFRWRGASVDKPTRISVLSSLSQSVLLPGDHLAAEIVELPGELNSSVSCLASCEESGRIAVGMDTTVRIFTVVEEELELREGSSSSWRMSSEDTSTSLDLSSTIDLSKTLTSKPHLLLNGVIPIFGQAYPTPGSVTRSSALCLPGRRSMSHHKVNFLLDIHTSMSLHSIAIFNNYVACISEHEVRVLKISLLADPNPSHSTTAIPAGLMLAEHTPSVSPAATPHPDQTHMREEVVVDESQGFIKWSPLRVWEQERLISSLPSSTSSSLLDISIPGLLHQQHLARSHDLQAHPTIGTLSLTSITNSLRKSHDSHAVEVLGPVEHVSGQPIRINLEVSVSNSLGARNLPPKARVLTMLYRRFPSSITGADARGASVDHTYQKGEELHTVQLLPVVITDDSGRHQLVGISCFLANGYHGYLYDVHLRGCLSCSFSFMSTTRAVVCDTTFLHAVSAESVETYTSRSLQTAISRMPAFSEHNDKTSTQWLRKPCPPPSLDLTLVANSKFASNESSLASSTDHMVLLIKSNTSEHAQSSTKWLLQSLTFRKPVESSWNIYVLKKKSAMAMHYQFAMLAAGMKDTSPPLYQHGLYEAHNLLRSQLLLNWHQTSQQREKLVQDLRTNCYALGLSLCTYASSRSCQAWAPKYLQMSGQSVSNIISTITKQFPRKSSPPYTILLKFVDLVLRSENVHSSPPPPLTQREADLVLDLYAEFRVLAVPRVVLSAWLGPLLSPDGTVEKVLLYLQQKKLNQQQISLGKLCEVLQLLRLDREEEASIRVLELGEPFLCEWLQGHSSFLVQQTVTSFTLLGKLLCKCREVCVLKVLYHLLATAGLTLDFISSLLLLQVDSSGAGTREEKSVWLAGAGEGVERKKRHVAGSIIYKHFLENIVLGEVNGLPTETVQGAQLHLVNMLLARLTSETTPHMNSTPFRLYGSRHKWLDSLPPFTGTNITKLAQVTLQDLMQLQALLCSSHMTTSHSHMMDVAQHVEACLMESVPGERVPGELALRLLAYPHIGKLQQAIELVLAWQPDLTVQYCHTYFTPQLDQWKNLLELLLHHCLLHRELINAPHTLSPLSLTLHSPPAHPSHSPLLPPSCPTWQPSPPAESQTYISLYKAALDHVVELCSPEDLLSLLPASGSLSFFLPFIRRSCKLHLSRQLAHPTS